MMLEEESLLQRIVRGVVQIVVVIALARLCVYSFGTVGTMPGQSMRPALEDGDQVLLDRLPCDSGGRRVTTSSCLPLRSQATSI